MKRKQAVKLLKLILEGSSYPYYKSITLLLHPKNGLSTGYQIQIKSLQSEFIESHILKIAEENNLAVTKKNSTLIIYRPQKTINFTTHSDLKEEQVTH